MIKLKRAYDEKTRGDGLRILVDRLWPRGIKKDQLPLDEWAKELAPSTKLRQSFNHDPKKFGAFKKAYKEELKNEDSQEKLEALAKKAGRRHITLLYGARDEEHNHALVLKEVLERKLGKK